MKLPPRPVLSPDLLGAVATSTLFDFMAVQLDAQAALAKRFKINWTLSDRDERISQTLANETLTQLMNKHSNDAAVAVETTRETLVSLIVRKTTVSEAADNGVLKISGSQDTLEELFSMLDNFDMQFSILTPDQE